MNSEKFGECPDGCPVVDPVIADASMMDLEIASECKVDCSVVNSEIFGVPGVDLKTLVIVLLLAHWWTLVSLVNVLNVLFAARGRTPKISGTVVRKRKNRPDIGNYYDHLILLALVWKIVGELL